MSDLPNRRPSLAESATAENTEGGVGQHPSRAQETEGMKCWNVRLSKPNDLTADSSRGTCTTRWVRWLLQPGREPQPVTVIVNVMLGTSADRLHRPPARLADMDRPRSRGATAAALLPDRPFHQPAAVPTGTPVAETASMLDISAASSESPSSPALSDRPRFPEFTGHNSRNPHQ